MLIRCDIGYQQNGFHGTLVIQYRDISMSNLWMIDIDQVTFFFHPTIDSIPLYLHHPEHHEASPHKPFHQNDHLVLMQTNVINSVMINSD